ncbi:sel1 repeat family protein [Qipengyuania marisflavi]|uniref:Sel1 repeat family protein n=1 Tax=Qipengyuania marisflavi TaxID=2486356 RepID=A0A5S3P4T4_9SPHN|nr:sel1 repeat family protein [Qipengyuania marisflavi]TMM48049.1 sel1 repeat family protein [Qipengyuania marisflavi]
MRLTGIEGGAGKIVQGGAAAALLAECLGAYETGSVDALFDLGVAFSAGGNGVTIDMVEAHKWFNIAAAQGHEDAAFCRADVSDEMTAREIAEAQRRARHWLAEGQRKTA